MVRGGGKGGGAFAVRRVALRQGFPQMHRRMDVVRGANGLRTKMGGRDGSLLRSSPAWGAQWQRRDPVLKEEKGEVVCWPSYMHHDEAHTYT